MLIIREIIFEEFHNTLTLLMDGQRTCHGNTALRIVSRGKNVEAALFVTSLNHRVTLKVYSKLNKFNKTGK